MNEPHDPNETVDVSSAPADSLDAGSGGGLRQPSRRRLQRAVGDSGSTPGILRPVLLKEARGRKRARRQAGVRRHAVEGRDRRPLPALRRDRPRRHGGRAARPRCRSGPRPGGQGAAGEVRRSSRRGPAVHRRGADRRAVAAPGRGAGLRHRPVRRPAVLHHEAGEGPDTGRHPRPSAPTRRPIGRACWGSPCRWRRRWPMPTPRG